jgi:serine/threonine protein kinase
MAAPPPTPDGISALDDSVGPTVDIGTRGAHAPLERGATVGRYVVLDQIGAGGMGVVYKAYDPELDRTVALKLLQGEGGASAFRERLAREAQALARLSHPNVIAVHDVGSFAGVVFLAMEYVDGETLRQWLSAKPPPSRRAILDAFIDAGEGLAAAHRAGLVPRDFKPDNVMVGRDGRVRVLDFGLARRRSRGRPSRRYRRRRPLGLRPPTWPHRARPRARPPLLRAANATRARPARACRVAGWRRC